MASHRQAMGKPWASHGKPWLALASHWQAMASHWQAIGKPSASHLQTNLQTICWCVGGGDPLQFLSVGWDCSLLWSCGVVNAWGCKNLKYYLIRCGNCDGPSSPTKGVLARALPNTMQHIRYIGSSNHKKAPAIQPEPTHTNMHSGFHFPPPSQGSPLLQ